jgi:hypothetical protein
MRRLRRFNPDYEGKSVVEKTIWKCRFKCVDGMAEKVS